MNIVAVIPARSGSKGLTDKNIRTLGSHPLLAYSVQAALDSKLITRTICSTDSQRIADMAKSYGAEVPFLRPKEYAQDDSSDFDVFYHLAQELSKKNELPDIFVQLRPTSPVRTNGLVDTLLSSFLETARVSEVDSLRTVCEPEVTPYKMWTLEKGRLKPLLTIPGIPEPYNAERQQLPETYAQTGTVDIFWSKTLLQKKSMTGDEIIPHIMEKKYLIDIDDQSDLDYAEYFIQKNKATLVVPKKRL